MYASIKSVAVSVCFCKECSFHMYASIRVSVVMVCSYKTGMLLKQTSFYCTFMKRLYLSHVYFYEVSICQGMLL